MAAGTENVGSRSEPELDATFLADLNRAVNLRLKDESLILRLDNGNGLMRFDRATEIGA